MNSKMSTCLCDVHVDFIRPYRYNNLGEWMSDQRNTYIGRRGIILINSRRFPEKDSIWHNPFKVDKDGDLQTVLNKYYEYITAKIIRENLFEELFKLKGKCLGCWCVGKDIVRLSNPPWKCHGQILLYLINYYFPDKPQENQISNSGTI